MEISQRSLRNRFLGLSAIPLDHDLALLVLRITIGVPLFLKHGLEKVTNFSQMAARFPDPVHIGPVPSLVFALFSDAICSLLILFGLGTRLAALVVVINLAVAFGLVHKFAFFGPHNGEVAFVYLGAALTLVLAGGGRFSLDRALTK
jgi:putative oxidoreductase